MPTLRSKVVRKLRSLGNWNAREVLFGKPFEFFQRFGIHIFPVHYESPIPDTRELREKLPTWYKEWSFTGVDFDLPGQKSLLKSMQPYAEECATLPSYEEVMTKQLGVGYGPVESQMLYAMIRHFKPRTIMEVGSGISTFYSARALESNAREGHNHSRMVCIEPYPYRALRDIAKPDQLEIIPQQVQETSPELFGRLGEGDFLFIDSSHVAKINSDVNYLYLEVLPRLKKGVIIHIHDIPFPYPTPDPHLWIFKKHRFWTESALVHAFLINNALFKIILCGSYLHYKAPMDLQSAFPLYDPRKHFPSSLWLQKVG